MANGTCGAVWRRSPVEIDREVAPQYPTNLCNRSAEAYALSSSFGESLHAILREHATVDNTEMTARPLTAAKVSVMSVVT